MERTGRQNKILNHNFFLFFVFTLLNMAFAFAGPSRTTYQAKIIKPDGYPLEASTVNFKFTILDPVGSCILYAETYSNVNMGSSAGLVSFSLGSGVRTFPVSGSTFEQVFSNTTASLPCDAGGPGTYSPLATDTRRVVMQFHDGNGWQTLPAMTINAVPYAMYANDSLKFSGKDITDFVQVASLPTCTASEAVRFNGAGFSCVAVGNPDVSVTSSSVIAALGYTPADGADVTSTLSSVSSTVFSVSSTVTSLQNSVTASFATITSSQWIASGTAISYQTGPVEIGNYGAPEFTPALLVASDVNAISGIEVKNHSTSATADARFTIFDTQTNYIAFSQPGVSNTGTIFGLPRSTTSMILTNGSSGASARDLAIGTYKNNHLVFGTGSYERMRITASGSVGIGTSFPVTTLDVAGGIKIGTEANSCSATFAGTLRYNSGVVEYCNGTTWVTFGVSGAGILSINGLVSGSQTFALGVSGVAPNVSSTGTVHTFNFPMASAATTTAGLISYNDYLNFSNKQSATSAAVVATLGYTPANVVSVTTLSSTVSSLSVTTAASFAAITSSQWVSSASTIYYNNGNVGIGTTSPNSKLHVGYSVVNDAVNTLASFGYSTLQNRSINIQSIGNFSTNDQYILLSGTLGSGSVVGTPTLTSAFAPSFGLESNDTGMSLITANWGTNMTPVRALTVAPSGNIGIGTSAPDSNLHIVSTSPGNGVKIQGTGTNAPAFRLYSGSNLNSTFGAALAAGHFLPGTAVGDSVLTTNISSNLIFGTSATEKMRITSAGNVGIGIAVPTAKLHLTSGTSVTAALRFTASTLTASAQTGAMEYDGANFYLTDASNNRRAIATGSSSGSIDNASIINSTGNISMVPVGSVIVSSTTPSTSTSTGALIVKGGAGIAGDINVGGSISGGNTGQINFAGNLGDGSGGMRLSSVGSVDVAIDTDNNDTIRQFRVMTNGSDRASATTLMAVTEAGNVGIGTTAPTVALDVIGTFRLATSVSSAANIEMGNMIYGSLNPGFSTSNGAYIQGPSNGSFVVDLRNNQSDDAFAIRYSASNTGVVDSIGMVLNGQGRMGIGTSSPTSTLHVSGTIRADENLTISGAGSFSNNGSGVLLLRPATNEFRVQNSTGVFDYFTVKAGNVGIGTSAPATRLHIVDNVANILTLERANNQNSLIEYKNTLGSVFAGQINGTTGWGIGPGLDLGATGVFQVTSTGRVYIGGATAPTARLHITPGTSSVAPIRLALGTLLTSPQSGTIEYDGTDYYVTDNSGIRRTIATATTGGVLTNTNTVSSTSGITLWPAAGNSVVVSSTVTSTNSSTGALIVNGGAGIAGALNVGGIISGSAIIKGTGFRANQGIPDNGDNSTVGYAFGADGDTGLFSTGTAGPTNGQLSFYSNNGERMRMTASGALGIGQIPTAQLHVFESTTLGTGFGSYDLNNAVLRVQEASGNGLFADGNTIISDVAGGFSIGTIQGQPILFGTSNTERMRVDTNGNLGIATTAAISRLDVNYPGSTPNATNSDANNFINKSGFRVAADFGAGSNALYFGVSELSNTRTSWIQSGHRDPAFATFASDSELVLQPHGGNVGIGTSAPVTRLDVLGPLYSASYPVNSFVVDNAGAATGVGGGLGFGGYISSGTAPVVFGAVRGSKENATTSDVAGYLSLMYRQALSPALTEGLRITSTGNVGIGTSAPTAKFEVKGSDLGQNINDTVELQRFNSYNGNVGLLDIRQIRTASGTNWFSAGSRIQQKIDATWMGYLQFNGSGNEGGISFGTNQTTVAPGNVPERMRITNTGNVGIGTSNPTSILSIEQNSNADTFVNVTNNNSGTLSRAGFVMTNIGSAYGSNSAGILLGGVSSTTALNQLALFSNSGIVSGINISASAGGIRFSTGAIERMRVDSSGYVGIGKQEAAAGTSGSITRMVIHPYGHTGGPWKIDARDLGADAFLDFYYGAGQVMTFENDGDVGIGTSTPLQKLHVSGNVQVNGDIYGGLYGGTRAIWRFSTADPNFGIFYTESSPDRISFAPNGGGVSTPAMVVHGNNVGIGVSAPTYQLQLSTDSAAKPGTSTWTIASDERLKNIRAPFTRGIAALNGLNTVYFNYKQDNPLGLPSSKEFVGIKAQDVLKVIPEAVTQDSEGFFHVTNDSIIWTAVNAIKEIYHKLIGVEVEIKNLKVENAVKDRKIQSLEQENAAIKAYLCSKDPAAPICQ